MDALSWLNAETLKRALPSYVFSAYCFTICHLTCCSADRTTFSHGNSMSAVLANVHINCIYGSQKLDAILCGPCRYNSSILLSQNGLRSNLRAPNFLKISWGTMPPDPTSLACLCIHEQSTNHISLIKTGLDVMQSHPLRRTRFGQYQASSAALG